MAVGRVRAGAMCCVALSLALGACSSGTASTPVHLHLEVTPARALLDTPISVRVSGAHPGDKVTIATASTDARGTVWKSAAVFAATTDGTVRTTQAPTSGPYTGANPMGLFQDETPGGESDLEGSGVFFGPTDDWKIAVTASDGDASTDATTIARLYPTQLGVTGRTLRPATDDGLYGEFERPASTTVRRPAVLVFGGSEGGVVTFKSELIAARGYPALALAYFHAPGLPAQLNRIPIEYFAKALQWLAKQPGVDPHRLVVFGVSRGSEAALLTALHYPHLVAGVVAGSPSNLVFGALPGDGHSAWTFGGREVPFASGADLDSASAPDNPAAVIPVGRIQASIYAVCGTDDQLWGSCTHVQAIQAAAAQPPTVLRWDGAGHYIGSLLPDIPEYGDDGSDAAGQHFTVGGNQVDDEAGRAAGWATLLQFLDSLPAVAS